MRGIPHYDNVRPSLDIRQKVNQPFSFSLQRRNEAQAIVNAADITNWEKKNTRAMQNIFGTIKEEQSRILMTCNSAREMWIKLETEYEEAAADSIPLLWTKFYGCTFRQGQSVSSFLTELEQIAFRLKSLNIAIDDEQIMAKVLMSLPAEFRVFGFAWESTPVDEKTLKRLTTRLITLDKSMRNDEEKRSTPDAAFLSKNKNGAESHDEESRERALPAQFDRGKRRGHSSHQQSRATKECWECKSMTHVRAQCRQYKRRREKEEEEADRKRKLNVFFFRSAV